MRQVALTFARRLGPRVDLDDLIQDGVFGLVAATEHFDPTRGASFDTYARLRVRGAIVDGLRRARWSRGLCRLHRRHHDTPEALTAQDQYRLSVVHGLTLPRTTPAAWMPDGAMPGTLPSPEATVHAHEVAAQVHRALRRLKPRDRRLIRLYYGAELSMQEIADRFDVTIGRISQLHAAALRRLKTLLEPAA